MKKLKMKRFWGLVLAFVLALTSVPLTGLAEQDETEKTVSAVTDSVEEDAVDEAAVLSGDGIVASGTCGESLVWSINNVDELIINGQGSMDDYSTKYDAPWYDYQSEIISVIIGDKVTSIGAHAFDSCVNLKNLTIGENVIALGSSAFYDCTGLEEIHFNATNMNDLESANYVFYNAGTNGNGICVTIKNNVTVIPAYLFSPHNAVHNVNIKKVNFENGSDCTQIGDYAFYYSTELTFITIPSNVTSIGDYAFYYCTGLTSITIPSNVTSIGYLAFSSCSNLTGIWVNEDNLYYSSDEFGVLYNNEMTTLIQAPGSIQNEYLFPDSVTTIGNYAFAECDKLTSITLSESITNIETNAFYGCDKLSFVLVPDSVVEFGNDVFGECPALTSAGPINEDYSIEFGWNQTIPENAFYGCNSLQNVNIPDGITNIQGYAFYGCSNLSAINIPSSVVAVGELVFYACTSLLTAGPIGSGCNIEFGWEEEIPANAFHHAYELTDITLPPTIKSIDANAFFHCWELKNIILPEGLTRIGSSAFQECATLEHIIIPSSVNTTGTSIFKGCKKLISAGPVGSNCNIEYGWNSYIPQNAFYDADYLRDISLPDSISSIEDLAFTNSGYFNNIDNWSDTVLYIGSWLVNGTDKPTDTIIGNGYTTGDCIVREGTIGIADNAFRGCSAMKSIVIPDSIKYIGNHAFYSCTGLNQVVFPENVVSLSIGNYSFYDCVSLDSIDIPDGTCSIGDYAFCGCSSLSQVTIPRSVSYMGCDVFSGCSLSDVYFGGSKSEWEALTGKEYDEEKNSYMHFAIIDSESGSDDDESGSDDDKTSDGTVKYFSEWDAENQIAYFGRKSYQGSKVTEDTDPAFLENVDDLVGKYVLVEYIEQDDDEGLIQSSILHNAFPVDTCIGIVSSVNAPEMIIDDKSYSIPEGWNSPEVYEGKLVIYHLYEGQLVGIETLKSKKGMLTYWNSDNKKLTIDPEQLNEDADTYYLSNLADEKSLNFLGTTGYTKVSVAYITDNEHFVYKIEKSAEAVDPDWEEWSEEQEELFKLGEAWLEAYTKYNNAVHNALKVFSETNAEARESVILAEAKRMQESDQKSASKYLSGNLGGYEKEAYKALATYFYEYVTDNVDFSAIDPSNVMAGVTIINEIMSAMDAGGPREYEDGNVKIIINASSALGTAFGKMSCIVTNKNNVTRYDNIVICSTREDCEKALEAYIDELKDLATNSAYNIATSVYKDILNKPLSSLTKEYLDSAVAKIEKRLAVTLNEKFNVAGVGNLINTLDECYMYYIWAYKAVNAGDLDDLSNVMNQVMNLKFEDTTIKNGAVRTAMQKLNKAFKALNTACNNYLSNKKPESEKAVFSAQINCAVNVSVFNSSGEQIGYVGNDDIWYDNSIKVSEFAGSKQIIFLTDDLPKFVISGTEYGSMSCSFEEYDDNHMSIGRLNYYDIIFAPDQKFSIILENDLAANADTLTITSDDESIYADEYIFAAQSAEGIVTCNVVANDGNEGGNVSGVGSYTRGDAAILVASPVSGYQFIGWYVDDVLMSCSPFYEFTVKGNTNVTAQFYKDTYLHVNVIADGGGTVIGNCKYSDGDTATVIAEADENYTFDGWYIDDNLVSNETTYQFTVTKNVTLIARFSEAEHIIHTTNFVSAVEATCQSKGNRAYYTCSGCDNWFEDAEGTILIENHDSVIIPELGHDYIYADNNDGTHTVTCSRGDDCYTEEHKFENHICSLCGAREVSVKPELSTCKLTLSESEYTYDGTQKEPDVTITNGDQILEEVTDYTVTYSNNVNAGTASVTATGQGNYTGTITETFTIKKADKEIKATISSANLTEGETATIEASATAGALSYSSSDTAVATVDEDGVVTAVSIGTATITITTEGNENYNPATTAIEITVTENPQPHTHEYDDPVFEWAEDYGCKAVFTCKDKDDEQILDCTVTSTITNPTDITDGKIVYTATVEFEEKTYTDTRMIVIPATGEELPKQNISCEDQFIRYYGDKDFCLKAENLSKGGAKLKYTSSDKKVVNVSGNGKVSIKGVGKAVITITAAEVKGKYAETTKEVIIIVNQKKKTGRNRELLK